MREIEFRGKTKSGKWVYGDLLQGENYYISTKEDFYSAVVSLLGHLSTHVELIDKNTLGQYTGLKDRNGKKIFEGDIVRTNYKEVREYHGVKYDDEMDFVEKIVWSKDYNGWCLEIEEMGIKLYRRLNFCEEVNGIKLFAVEVIGNVYDTPELLEEEE